MNRIKFLIFITIAATGIYSCSDSGSDPDPMPQPETFDRGVFLTNVADNIIIPAFESYSSSLSEFVAAKNLFISDPSNQSLELLRDAWLNSYMAWQEVSIFDIGKAEQIGLRNFSNIYPTDIDQITENIEGGDYNLVLPSNYDAQGFPALDYLLFGIEVDDESVINRLSQESHAKYLSDLVDRLESITTEVLTDWNEGYRDEFVENVGSSGTASTDKIVNDFLFYYEKFLRAGKIGIPAGVFSGSTDSYLVEAPYSGVYSKELFEKGFSASRNFFNGISFVNGSDGIGLDDYLDASADMSNTQSIKGDIINQWDLAQNRVDLLMDNFRLQVENDNASMLSTYDELQKAVVLLKVDMMQALNIQVDFIDADGD